MAQSRTFEMSLLEGEWPAEIRGHHWINGPGKRLPWQKHSIFAPGVLQRLDLQPKADGRLSWHWRESHAYDVEAALAHLEVFEDPRAFHVLGGPLLTGVNNSFFLIDDRVFLTADFNRPWEIDPESMQLRTPVGAVVEWGGSARLSMLSPSVPTTAHPFYDRREGILYDYTSKPAPANGTSLSRFQHQLFVATWDGRGSVRRWEVPGAGLSQYVHEIAGTRNFILLLESSSFQIETGIAWFGLPKLEPHLPVSNLYVVRKSDLVEANRVRGVPFRKIEVPVEAFHVLADYEDDGQCVDLWLAHGNGLDFLVTNGPADVHWKTGKPFERWQLDRFIHADYAPIGRYRVDVDRERVVESHRVIDYDRWWGAGVWSWDPRPANPKESPLYVSWLGYDSDLVSRRLMDLYGDRPHRILPPQLRSGRQAPAGAHRRRLGERRRRAGVPLSRRHHDDRQPVHPPPRRRGRLGGGVPRLPQTRRAVLALRCGAHRRRPGRPPRLPGAAPGANDPPHLDRRSAGAHVVLPRLHRRRPRRRLASPARAVPQGRGDGNQKGRGLGCWLLGASPLKNPTPCFHKLSMSGSPP